MHLTGTVFPQFTRWGGGGVGIKSFRVKIGWHNSSNILLEVKCKFCTYFQTVKPARF